MQTAKGHDIDDLNEVVVIDLWFSERRDLWIVERVAADGVLLGLPVCCRSRDAAEACASVWLWIHPAAHLETPPSGKSPRRRVSRTNRRAA